MTGVIVGVGVATLDIINSVEQYPSEDEEIRATGQSIARGGNASNSLSVLALLGHRVEFMGTLADDADGLRVRAQLEREKIAHDACPIIPDAATPVSYICRSEANGSRTIIHHRRLRELSFADFSRLDLKDARWVHFEGRNIDQTKRMIARVRALRPRIPVSVEIEKPRPGIETLFDGPDLLLFSKHFVTAQGFDSARRFLETLRIKHPASNMVCAWGEGGAYASGPTVAFAHESAVVPNGVVDTLGAGDVFNAGIIHSLYGGHTLHKALDTAVRLAGLKCGLVGTESLAQHITDFRNEP